MYSLNQRLLKFNKNVFDERKTKITAQRIKIYQKIGILPSKKMFGNSKIRKLDEIMNFEWDGENRNESQSSIWTPSLAFNKFEVKKTQI
jgi:hypothetical protein